VRNFKPSLLLLVIAALGGGRAAAQTAAELLAEGNQLVRSGIYRTALLRYREAASAGLDTPLLHYNLGVVHYELGDFAESADAFARAAVAPALGALASYNRGLALRGAGDSAAASAAFRTAAEGADHRNLRRLATAAAQQDRGGDASPAAASGARRFEGISEPAASIGVLELAASARLGRDDNVYRTPVEPYFDLSDPAQPLVTPVATSASFVPAQLRAAYVLENESGDTEFLFRYDMEGAFYDAELSNATEVDQRLSMGADILLGESERRRRAVDTAFFVSTHRETNFDPDDGLARDVDVVIAGQTVTEDVSDRFAYKAAGVQGSFTHTLGRVTWGFDLRFERDEYERTELVANFDHDYFFTGVDIHYDFSDVMALNLGLRQYRTKYDERPARDLTGALLDTNPAQQYSHRGLQLGLERKIGGAVDLEADYLRLGRTDDFLGYYDYTQDVLRVRFGFRPMARLRLSLAAIARSYDYPRAFAFHVAAGGARELEEAGIVLEAEYRIGPRFALSAELDALDVTSTDARAAHRRSQATLGVEWRK
jgi:tetratricopeptide (TPR) repeat protein